MSTENEKSFMIWKNQTLKENTENTQSHAQYSVESGRDTKNKDVPFS